MGYIAQKVSHMHTKIPATITLLIALLVGKIQAIKHVRYLTNTGLKEAKDWVEEMFYFDTGTSELSPQKLASFFGGDLELYQRMLANSPKAEEQRWVRNLEDKTRELRQYANKLQNENVSLQNEVKDLTDHIAANKSEPSEMEHVIAEQDHTIEKLRKVINLLLD